MSLEYDYKGSKKTIEVKSTSYKNYQINDKFYLLKKTIHNDDPSKIEEKFELNAVLKREDLYALKAIIEDILKEDI
jgi:hypothetical protein